MLLVALGQGSSTKMKTQELVFYMTMWSCAVICTAGGFLLLEDEIQEGAEQFTWRDSQEENFDCVTPMCAHMCVAFPSSSYLVLSCAQLPRTSYTGPDRLCGAMFYIRRIYAHACSQSNTRIHTNCIYEIQIKSHALSTLIDAQSTNIKTSPTETQHQSNV